MKYIYLIAEGLTEKYFADEVLAPHFSSLNLTLKTSIINNRAGNAKGGRVTFTKIGQHVRLINHPGALITTLIDYYGFEDKGRRTVEEVEETLKHNIDNWRFIPYIQLHDFEALLFSSVAIIADHMNADTEQKDALEKIIAFYDTPEHINDSIKTAPSKRLEKIFPTYKKIGDGIPIAKKIGLAAIRAECPRFNNWITRLES